MSSFAPWVDLLTGAWKREHFDQELARVVQGAHWDASHLSLLWIDVDELEVHNDVHGRASVDAALAWLASRISILLDGRGPIARLEGGAFGVYLPSTSREQALRLSEELRQSVPRTLHSSAFGDYRLTVSVGVAVLRRSEPWGNFIDAAEYACRCAKQGGRDAVVAR
ncbi:MAG: GGDEF domain-containing protein [Myxococcaceae bacterium]